MAAHIGSVHKDKLKGSRPQQAFETAMCLSPKYPTAPSTVALHVLGSVPLVAITAFTEVIVPDSAEASKAAKDNGSNHSVHDVSVKTINPRGSNMLQTMPGRTRPATLFNFLRIGSGRSVAVDGAAGTLQPSCNAKAAAARGGGSRKAKLKKCQAAVYQPAGGGTTGSVTTHPSILAA